MRTDPRVRQTLNQISQNLESANESAQANLFAFSQGYLGPCLASLGACLDSCSAPCFPDREERLRRSRGRTRGRAEASFDFYDDWNDDGSRDALLGWDNDELDSFMANSTRGGRGAQQPGRERVMSYGSRGDRQGQAPGRRKTTTAPQDVLPDPTIIPSSSLFGFLERLPWKIGGKGHRYKPSAADLSERSGAGRAQGPEGDPLLEDDGASGGKGRARKHRRTRSDTAGSEATTDSLSSRGDLFPSDDEDDAVPLDDEFAMVLERRTTGSTGDENSGRRARGKHPSGSRSSTRTGSSKETTSSAQPGQAIVPAGDATVGTDMIEVPSLTDLQKEEERLRTDEEREVERKREAAKDLALKRGLSYDELATAAPPENGEASQGGEPTPSSPVAKDTPADPTPDAEETSPSAPSGEPPQTPQFIPAQLPVFSTSQS
ncbi:MAG: hypothetical protein M1832_005638 [Thelocarpon impressellum]|nr:MAG: hypothetical protein M1832_005638 [Thelocarpon impressellum]